MLVLVFILHTMLRPIAAHSWVRCTDYKAPIRGNDYNENNCRGWVRGADFNNHRFGRENRRGGDVHKRTAIGSNQPICSRRFNGNANNKYSPSYRTNGKLTQYTVGQKIRMVWPAKNHVNAPECGKRDADKTLKLFINPNPNPTRDLPNSAKTMEGNGYKLVYDFHAPCANERRGHQQKPVRGCGFQNCPAFCKDKPNAVCFGDFVLDGTHIKQSGYYTFAWYWILSNFDVNPWISCYEAYVTVRGGSGPQLPPPTPPSNRPANRPANNPPANSGGYRPIRMGNGQCLDMVTLDRYAVRPCNGQQRQRFSFSNGVVRSENVNRCLSVVTVRDHQNKRNGALVKPNGCWGGDSQKWRFEGGALKSSNGLCLDWATSGNKLQVWGCWGGVNQRFRQADALVLDTPTGEAQWSWALWAVVAMTGANVALVAAVCCGKEGRKYEKVMMVSDAEEQE